MKYLSSLAVALILAGCAGTDSGTSTSSSDWTCQYCKNVEIHQTGTGFWFDFPSKDGVHYVTKNLSGSPAVLTANDRITGQAPKVESAQTILGAVPVLADSRRPLDQLDGEARESTDSRMETRRSAEDSRGGTQTISALGHPNNIALTVQSSGAATATFTISGAGRFTAMGGGTPQVSLYFQHRGDPMSCIGDYQYYRWWSVQTVVLKNGTFTLTVPLTPKNWKSCYGVTGNDAAPQFNAAKNDMVVAGMTFGGIGAGHGVSGSGKFTLTDWRIQ